MTDSPELSLDIKELELGTGFSLLCKNRQENSRGYSAGGVAIAYRKNDIEVKEIMLPGNNYEMLFAVGNLPKFTRKFVLICVYMPPGLCAAAVQSNLEYLVDSIIELKSRYKDPFIVIAGDFNSYPIARYLSDYPDIQLVTTGPTRGNHTLDLVFTNFGESIEHVSTLDPLENDLGGQPSDHCVIYCSAHLPRYQAYDWVTFSYMRQTESGNVKFKEWIVSQEWNEVVIAMRRLKLIKH